MHTLNIGGSVKEELNDPIKITSELGDNVKQELQEPIKIPMSKTKAVEPPPGLLPDAPPGLLAPVQDSSTLLTPCTSRCPLVGDRVQRLSLEETTLHDSSGGKDSWKLSPMEVAVVVEVDNDGDFRLRNTSGYESGFTFRQDYGYIKAEEALKACFLANQAAELALQNAQDLNAYAAWPSTLCMDDPCYGYVQNPWALPTADCPPMYPDPTTMRGWLASKLSRKAGKENMAFSFSDTAGNWGSFSTASVDSASWGQNSLLSSLSSVEGVEEQDATNPLDGAPSHKWTTVMMRNIPNNCTRAHLIRLIDDEGFQGCYDLVYLPIDLKNKVGLGYAFLNFKSNGDAKAFIQHFHGFTNWKMKSEKICQVTWSDAMQGLEEHVDRYRDSPVMHDSVPEEFKPLLFKDGQRVPFPEPTRKLRAPRPWSRRH